MTPMKIVICASMSAAKRVMDVADELEKMGHELIIPRNMEKYADGTLDMENAEESTQNKIEGDLIRGYFEEIKNCDAVLTVNEEKKGIVNYIGGNTFLEMGFAHVLGKKNFILNDIPEVAYRDEIIAMQPVILNGDLKKIV
jgi:predicted RNA-binding protein with PUA domain